MCGESPAAGDFRDDSVVSRSDLHGVRYVRLFKGCISRHVNLENLTDLGYGGRVVPFESHQPASLDVVDLGAGNGDRDHMDGATFECGDGTVNEGNLIRDCICVTGVEFFHVVKVRNRNIRLRELCFCDGSYCRQACKRL